MKTNQLTKLVAILATGLISTFANAQTYFGVGAEYFRSSDVDIKNSSDSLEVSGGAASITMMQVIGETDAFLAAVSVGKYSYDFDGVERWKDVKEFESFFMYESGISDRWSLLGLGLVRSGYEENASFSDGLMWGAGLGAKYRSSDTLAYSFGVAYISRLEEDGLWIPIVGVEWQINDRLYLESMLSFELVYDVTGDGGSLLSAGLDYNLGDFSLGKNAAAVAESAVHPEGFGFFVGYEQAITDSFSISAVVSAQGEQKFETWSDDQKISSFKTKSGLVYGVGFEFSF